MRVRGERKGDGLPGGGHSTNRGVEPGNSVTGEESIAEAVIRIFKIFIWLHQVLVTTSGIQFPDQG